MPRASDPAALAVRIPRVVVYATRTKNAGADREILSREMAECEGPHAPGIGIFRASSYSYLEAQKAICFRLIAGIQSSRKEL